MFSEDFKLTAFAIFIIANLLIKMLMVYAFEEIFSITMKFHNRLALKLEKIFTNVL